MASVGVTKSSGNKTGDKKDFEAIPEGTYDAEVARIIYKAIDLDKTPWLDKLVDRGVEGQIGFAFKITSGPHAKRWIWDDVAAEITDWNGCKLRLYLQELLQENELPESFTFDEADYDAYVGMPCRIRVKQYWSDKGKENRNSLEDVLAPTAKQVQALSPVVADFEEEPF